MNVVKTALKYASYFVFLLVATSLLFFSIIEIEPGLLKGFNLDRIKYYAYKKRYIYDDKLVFIAKDISDIKTIFNGDLYSKNYGIKPLRLPYSASYNNEGFRTNSSSQPYNVLLIGDSYLEFGENDNFTFSELFKTKSGLSVYNAGKGWYGPYQYIELLLQVMPKFLNGKKDQPKIAIFCFFSGNDIRDIKEYDKWLNGGTYYTFLPQQNFLKRYITVMSDIEKGAIKFFLKMKQRDPSENLGVIKIQENKIPMRFAYWNEKKTADQLLQKTEWKKLRQLLKQFNDIASKNNITPIVLYIPSKLQVYGNLYLNNESGVRFIANVVEQLKYETNSLEAMQSITTDLDIRFIELFSYFKKLANNGEQLYYSFDTHWNVNGRKHAAEYLYNNIGINP